MGRVHIPQAIVTTLCAFTKIIAAKAMISFQTREIGCTIEQKDNILTCLITYLTAIKFLPRDHRHNGTL